MCVSWGKRIRRSCHKNLNYAERVSLKENQKKKKKITLNSHMNKHFFSPRHNLYTFNRVLQMATRKRSQIYDHFNSVILQCGFLIFICAFIYLFCLF